MPCFHFSRAGVSKLYSSAIAQYMCKLIHLEIYSLVYLTVVHLYTNWHYCSTVVAHVSEQLFQRNINVEVRVDIQINISKY